MHTSCLLLAALLALDGACATPLPNQYAHVVKTAHPVPNTFSKVGPVPVNQVVNLQIGLKQSRFDELERQLYDGMFDIHSTVLQVLTSHSVRSRQRELWQASDH